MTGSKTFLAHATEQTIETSIGVMLMFRNPCFCSRLRLSSSVSREPMPWLGGRRTPRIGCRNVEYRLRGTCMRLSVSFYSSNVSERRAAWVRASQAQQLPVQSPIRPPRTTLDGTEAGG